MGSSQCFLSTSVLLVWFVTDQPSLRLPAVTVQTWDETMGALPCKFPWY